jgi:hypothetical protein
MKINKVLIHYVQREVTYVATCLRDCKDKIDEVAYELAIKRKEVVLLGEVCAEPVFGE